MQGPEASIQTQYSLSSSKKISTTSSTTFEQTICTTVCTAPVIKFVVCTQYSLPPSKKISATSATTHRQTMCATFAMCTQTVYMTPVIYGSNSISPIFLQEDFCLHLHKHVYSISQQDYRAFVMTRMYDFTLGNGYPCILHGGDCAFRVSLYNGDSRRNGTLLCYKDVAFIV